MSTQEVQKPEVQDEELDYFTIGLVYYHLETRKGLNQKLENFDISFNEFVYRLDKLYDGKSIRLLNSNVVKYYKTDNSTREGYLRGPVEISKEEYLKAHRRNYYEQ
jgi:hypothetical protein